MSNRTGLRAFHNARLRKQDAKAPTGFEALHQLGITHYQQGRYEEAEHLLKRAVAAEPRSAEAHSNRAAILLALKRFDEAIASCDQALILRPSYPEALSNRGIALLELGRFEEAIVNYDRALAIKPDFADALSNRGYALTELRRFDEAIASCTRATALDPRHASAFSNLGNVLVELRRFDEALASYDQALALNPNFPAAWLGRGNVLLHLKRFDDAREAFNQAIAIRPDYFKAWGQLAICHQQEGNIKGVLAACDRALAIKPDYAEGLSQKIFAFDFAADAEFADHQEVRREWWSRAGAKIAAASKFKHDNAADPDRPLVVGYISSDFRQHSASLVFKPVLRNHDRSRFRVICYSCSVLADNVTEEFKQTAHLWRDAAQWSDERLANQVHQDGVDILIDLSGHTEGHRLGVFARKPAPIQVTAWGNATGTGLPMIDYLFSDATSIPPAVRHLFAEKIWDLPCCITVDALPGELHPADPPVLANGYVTFGVFNRTSKISDASVAVWADILGRHPRARLLIKHLDVEDEAVRTRLTAKFGKHGVADRLDFLGSTSREQHLAAYQQVDICLDPFPQNGGISTWEALQMGVPVVAKLGNSVPSRVAGAILAGIGLDDWVADTPESYTAIALRYAGAPDQLRGLRHELPGRIAASSAGNPEKYTRAVEAAYRAMWVDYCRRVNDR